MQTDLFGFCNTFLKQYGLERIKHPESVALAVRQFYHLSGVISFADLESLALQEMGILSIEDHPVNCKGDGMHVRYGQLSIIFVRSQDQPCTKAFTVAHELRELIGEICTSLHPRFQDLQGQDLEAASDVFASTLLLGDEAFSIKLTDAGFDPVWLADVYRLAPNTVVRRIVKTLSGRPDSPRFWASMLRWDRSVPKGYLISRGSYRTPKFGTKSRDKTPNFLFPKRGQLVPITGFIWQALEYRRPVYIHRVTGLDFSNECCLSVIIRPMIRDNAPATVLIIGLPTECSEWLREQITRVRPLIQEKSFQMNQEL